MHQPAAAFGLEFVTEVAEGARYVFGDPWLRSLLLLCWAAAAFTVMPEALAVPYARDLHGGATLTGLLLAANPVGQVVAVVAVSRLPQHRRAATMRPLALLSCAVLVLAALHPPAWGVIAVLALSGGGMSFLIGANAAYAAAVPAGLRSRAFGVAATGLAVGQAIAMLAAGALAQRVSVATVVALAGVSGGLVVFALVARWPHRTIVLPEASRSVPEPVEWTPEPA